MDFADGQVPLEFSRDTVRFDTVFTQLGSATRSFKIRNPSDKWVRIDEMDFAATESKFRINVDGFNGAPIRGAEIPPNDSIYGFVEVTVDPDQPPSVSPFIIRDSLRVSMNGSSRYLQLEAWGQNANYIPGPNAGGTVSRLSCEFGRVEWDSPRPYVLWGVLLIDSCHLNIPSGTEVYVHGGIARDDEGVYNDGLIFTQPDGRLTIRGTGNEPVIIQGDRLEPAFDDIPGQWAGIRFGPGSSDHIIEHTIIRNAVNGVVLDSAADLRMEQTAISDCSQFALFARHASLEAENVLFNNAGQNCVSLNFGGEYSFDYCTLAGYGVVNSALIMNNFTCRDPICNNRGINTLDAAFTNCIITGSSEDEIGMTDASSDDDSDFNYSIDHCLVRVDDLLNANQWPDFFDRCTDCIEHDKSEPLFIDPGAMNYRLDSLSQVEGKARSLPTVGEDLTGHPRDPQHPDIGAYEYRPE